MHRIIASAVTLVAAFALMAPTAHAQECEYACDLASGYLSFAGQYRIGAATSDKDISVMIGWLSPRGFDGKWMVRGEAGLGASTYTPDAKNFGYFAGTQLGLVRVFAGDYLGLGTEIPIEFLLSAGAGAIVGWDLEDTPDERVFLPTLHAGAGIRARTARPGSTLVTLELLREEAIGDRKPRTFVRVSIGLPR